MSPTFLLLLAVAAVALLLVLVIRLKFPAFISLLLVSVLTALAAGIGPHEVIPLIMEGLGGTLGNVALLVGLGAMLGAIIERTGGAEVLAKTFTAKLGPRRVGPALLLASSIIAIPIFFDVAFIILIPIIYSFSKAAGMKNPMVYGLPLAFMLFIHVTIPPHPGIVGSVAVTGGDAGVVTLFGLLICVPVGVVSYYLSRCMTARHYSMLPETQENYDNFGTRDSPAGPAGTGSGHAPGATMATAVTTAPAKTLPSAGAVIFTILLPVLMIGLGTVGAIFVEPESTPANILKFIGAPAFALLTSSLVALFLLAVRNGWSIPETGHMMDAALAPAAIVVFVTGAGGVFAKVLTETGIGEAVSGSMSSLGIPLLLLAFLLAAILRAAQGSATVAAITTAGLLASSISAGGYTTVEIALLNLAIGCGAITLSHINDSGFWIVTRYLGLSVADGLKTWSVLVTAMGIAGFAVVAGLWAIV
ncbi:gluconate:H+ symporter [Citricoccus sp.]|uniref:GntT/GntP/DsdX family permease n=1 Tax=Citricoccus sp. TaxID=1978372 RepID=UPI0028BD2B0F|nr:gluconate:H+ symporter [Citricoccus sp.]